MSYWTEHSVGFAPQVAFGTPNTTDLDTRFLLCDKPKVSFTTEIAEMELLTGQVGSAPERLVGKRGGTFVVSMPLEGLSSTYDPTTMNPGTAGVVAPWKCLLDNVLGSNISAVASAADFWADLHASLSQYTSAGVASATSSILTLDNATASDKISVGEMVITATSATSTSPQIGFAKTKALQSVTLFSAAQNTVNDPGANVYGTSTGWLSSQHGNQLPMTIQWRGNATEACYYLTDAVCENVKISWDVGSVPTIEFNFKFFNFSVDKTAGGLEIPDSFKRIPQLVGAVNAVASLAGTSTCGLESCVLEYSTEIKEIKCHAATQGVTGVLYNKPRIRASMSIPWNSSDAVYDSAGVAGNTGSHKWQSYLERGVTTSVGMIVGSNVGKCFGFLVPAAVLTEVPSVEDLDGSVGFGLKFEAGSYSGDSTDTAESTSNSPIDSLFRISVG